MISRIVTPRDEEWPDRLRDLGPLPPPVRLHVRGAELWDVDRCIAVVGARNPSAAGLDAARYFARGLAEAGFGIVSGLAIGIDTAAHRAALSVGGHTIAVLGCGLNFAYPRRNVGLKEEIAAKGTVLSEYEDDVPPQPQNFPERNRIIAGLATATLVVEGGEKSGALITARAALDANRHVFAVPGSIRNPLAAGPNELIRASHAGAVTDVVHIFQELAPGLVWTDRPQLQLTPTGQVLEAGELRALHFLDDAPVDPDVLCEGLDVSFGVAALALSRLEARGFVVKRATGYEITNAGARYRRASGAAPVEV